MKYHDPEERSSGPAAPKHAGAEPINAHSKQLFRNPLLESLTRTHIAWPLGSFSIASAAMLWYAHDQHRLGAVALAVAFLIGLVFFTLVEYIVHRWLYHIAPSSLKRERLQFVMHGIHHEQPRDKSRLAMPLIMSLSVAVLLIGLFRWAGGPIGLPFGAGFIMGYAGYLFIHYSVHAFRTPRNFLRVLWKHHHLHHYASDNRAFGVSSPLWDWVFGTMPDLPSKQKRPHPRIGAKRPFA